MDRQEAAARFEETILVHLDAAYNLARWITRNEADAHDVVQEACLRALRGFETFRGGDARAWLLTIVRNASLTWVRRKDTATELDLETHQAPSEGADPQGIMLRDADVERVRRAIDALPTEIRTVMVLRELEELSYKQIAAISGVPMGTVMSRLSRGRQRLATLLTEPAAPAARLEE